MEAARQQLAQEVKRQYQERKKLIVDYIAGYNSRRWKADGEYYGNEQERAKKCNSVCPKCGSTHVINHIKRAKGEIHGEGTSKHYSSSSSFLFSHSSTHSGSSHSKIDGELDTLPVNKCKDCGNEWAIEIVKFVGSDNDFEAYQSHYPDKLRCRIEQFHELEYDPYDVTEECNSLEEMQDKFFKECGYFPSEYKKAPRYVLEYALYQAVKRHYLFDMEDIPSSIFGLIVEDVTDEYMYTMPDDTWDLVKKILGRED